MAQLAYHVAQGRELWNMPVHKSSVLYLALEDKFYRLQQRLVRMFDMDVADKLHMAVSANDLYNGLEEQVADFINKYPDVRLIIIDTLQKIRNSHDEKINYARDYNVGVKLKEIADKYNICLLVVHHTRKQQAEDSFEMISGSNGLFGAADGATVMMGSGGACYGSAQGQPHQRQGSAGNCWPRPAGPGAYAAFLAHQVPVEFGEERSHKLAGSA